MEVAVTDVLVDGVGQVNGGRTAPEEVGVREDVAGGVRPVGRVLNGIHGDLFKEFVDGLVDGGLNAGAVPALHRRGERVELLALALRQVAREVDGDVVVKGDDQILVAPTGVTIDREKLS